MIMPSIRECVMQMFLISYRIHVLLLCTSLSFFLLLSSPLLHVPTYYRPRRRTRESLLSPCVRRRKPPPHTYASRHNRKRRRRRRKNPITMEVSERRKISQKLPEARKAQRVLCVYIRCTTMHGRDLYPLSSTSSPPTHTRPKKRGGPLTYDPHTGSRFFFLSLALRAPTPRERDRLLATGSIGTIPVSRLDPLVDSTRTSSLSRAPLVTIVSLLPPCTLKEHR